MKKFIMAILIGLVVGFSCFAQRFTIDDSQVDRRLYIDNNHSFMCQGENYFSFYEEIFIDYDTISSQQRKAINDFWNKEDTQESMAKFMDPKYVIGLVYKICFYKNTKLFVDKFVCYDDEFPEYEYSFIYINDENGRLKYKLYSLLEKENRDMVYLELTIFDELGSPLSKEYIDEDTPKAKIKSLVGKVEKIISNTDIADLKF